MANPALNTVSNNRAGRVLSNCESIHLNAVGQGL